VTRSATNCARLRRSSGVGDARATSAPPPAATRTRSCTGAATGATQAWRAPRSAARRDERAQAVPGRSLPEQRQRREVVQHERQRQQYSEGRARARRGKDRARPAARSKRY